jgi:hypothetical protein
MRKEMFLKTVIRKVLDVGISWHVRMPVKTEYHWEVFYNMAK